MRVFVHMPKCAGTSTIHLMNKYAGVNDVQWQPNIDFLRSVSRRTELVSLYKTKPISVLGNPIIAGHIFPIRYVNQSNLNKEFRLVTILRDPIQRLMSHYLQKIRLTDTISGSAFNYKMALLKSLHFPLKCRICTLHTYQGLI